MERNKEYGIKVSLSTQQKEKIELEASKLGLNVPNYCRMVIFRELNEKKS